MKKLFTPCLILCLFANLMFAEGKGFLRNRIFEVKVDVPVDVSNNALSVSDFLVKDVVIDLQQICNSLPEKGFSFATSISPDLEINFSFSKVSFGVGAGIEAYTNIGTSKDLFEFIGNGNSIGEEVSVDINAYLDTFAYAQVHFGNKFGKLSTKLQPTAFGTLAHAVTQNSYAKFRNADDGSFNIDVNALFNIYSEFDSADFENKNFTDINLLINKLTPTIGFDLTGSAAYEISDILTVNTSARIPLVPSKLSKVTPYKFSMNKSISLDSLLKKEGDEGDSEGEEASTETSQDSDNGFGDTYSVEYKLHRPMKISLGAEFHPFGNFMNYFGSIGLGIRHPFAENKDELDTYFDYLVGVRVSLLNLIHFSVSTERTDEIYKHKAMLSLSVRLVQIDAGVALESTSLANSFKGQGVGAFVTAYVGL